MEKRYSECQSKKKTSKNKDKEKKQKWEKIKPKKSELLFITTDHYFHDQCYIWDQ